MKTPVKQQRLVEKFNQKFKVGDTVKLKMDDGSIKEVITTNAATIMGGHTAVGWFAGIRGAYILERVQM